MLFVRLSIACYGVLGAALLFYKKLRKDLENRGFSINPHDPCASNMVANSAQCTVCWHVDDLKVSYMDEAVVAHTTIQPAVLGTSPLTIYVKRLAKKGDIY